MTQEIITIGFDKDGEADFAISGSLGNLDPNKMNDLRSMIVVAIGTAEEMWRKAHEETAQINTAKTNV
jgi:hypothetical protein